MKAILKYFLGITVAISFVMALIGQVNKPSTPPKAPLTPAQLAEKEKQESEFQAAVAAISNLKRATNDPKSFELVDATLTDQGNLCVVFRGKNAYGGTVLNYASITKTTTSVSSEAWKKYCDKKAGRDMTNAKYAIF